MAADADCTLAGRRQLHIIRTNTPASTNYLDWSLQNTSLITGGTKPLKLGNVQFKCPKLLQSFSVIFT